MPDKRYVKGCGSKCLRCWRNRLIHGNRTVNKYLKVHDLDSVIDEYEKMLEARNQEQELKNELKDEKRSMKEERLKTRREERREARKERNENKRIKKNISEIRLFDQWVIDQLPSITVIETTASIPSLLSN